jgi:DNA-binding transcriptional regulator YiaG
MEPYTAPDEGATPAEQLARRIRAAKLPPPAERARIRREARITLREFAQVLGVTTTTVYRWEIGDADPKTDHAVAYADLLNKVRQALDDTDATTGGTA